MPCAYASRMMFAEALKMAREGLKETQEQFGRRFGVDQSTVHRWENEGVPDRGTSRMAVGRVLAELAEDAPAPTGQTTEPA